MEPKTSPVVPEAKVVVPPAPVPEGKAAEVKKLVNTPKEKPKEVEVDPIEALQKSGFTTKDEVLSFLKAVDREKKLMEVRTKEMQAEEQRIQKLHVVLDQREKDMQAKGEELQEKLKEYKIIQGRNQELVTKLSSLNLK